MKLACFTSFHPQPVTVEALAQDSSLGIVAEGLSDGSIRILDSKSLAVVSQIPGSKSRSVRKLVFYKEHLISCGIHGSASMWDLSNLVEVASVESSQGAIWDMALDGDKLYLATETGSVAVVDLDVGTMRISTFFRASSRAGTVRALSVCVESGHVFVGDARGSISRWTKGVCDATFSTPTKNDIPTLIWSLAPVGDGRFVSGDSLGGVSLWDVNSCTLLQARHDHQSDVLTVSVRGEELYTAGVDARVVAYRISHNKLHHVYTQGALSRDISALTLTESHVVVGGADARLAVVTKDNHAKLDRFSRDLCSVRNNLVFCLAESHMIKVFDQSSGSKSQYLAELDNVEDVASFTVNEEGTKVVIAGVSGKIRSVTIDAQAKETKASILTHLVGTVTAICVNDKYTAIAIAGKDVSVVDSTKKQPIQIANLNKEPVTHMRLFGGNKLLIATKNTLSVRTIGSKTKSAPSSVFDETVITAVSEIHDDGYVAIVTADQQLRFLSTETLEEKLKRKLPAKLSPYHHIKSVVINKNTLCLFGESHILTADVENMQLTSPLRFNSALPTGGAVVGSGKLLLPCDEEPNAKKSRKTEPIETVVAVLADFKTTSKALITPFERKKFQQ
jgi:WD40 repeat protein